MTPAITFRSDVKEPDCAPELACWPGFDVATGLVDAGVGLPGLGSFSNSLPPSFPRVEITLEASPEVLRIPNFVSFSPG